MERCTTSLLLASAAALATACSAAPATTSSGTPAPASPTATAAPRTTLPPITPDVAAPTIDPGDGGRYEPAIDPSRFAAEITHPYLPLSPGSRWVYRAKTPDGTERIVVTVTERRREVMGIPATVVRDTVTMAGKPVEDTRDWFAQDVDGNVWYLGERTMEYENGRPASSAGSWEAGVAGARPGIVMPADPQAGDAYRQEYLPGEAEDMAQVVSTGASARALGRPHRDVVQTKEWTPLEPDVVELKEYAPGIGQIGERTVAGGNGRVVLVSYRPGP